MFFFHHFWLGKSPLSFHVEMFNIPSSHAGSDEQPLCPQIASRTFIIIIIITFWGPFRALCFLSRRISSRMYFLPSSKSSRSYRPLRFWPDCDLFANKDQDIIVNSDRMFVLEKFSGGIAILTHDVTRQKQRVPTIVFALRPHTAVCPVEGELHLPYTILHCATKLMMCWLGHHSFPTV